MSENDFFYMLGSEVEKELSFSNTMNRVFSTIIESISDLSFLEGNKDYIESIKAMKQHIAYTLKTNDSN